MLNVFISSISFWIDFGIHAQRMQGCLLIEYVWILERGCNGLVSFKECRHVGNLFLEGSHRLILVIVVKDSKGFLLLGIHMLDGEYVQSQL